MLHSEIQNKMPEVIRLFIKHKVKDASVFGSVLDKNFNKESDIDFVVNLKEGIDPAEAGGHLWDLQDELEILLQRQIDIITERSLKNPYFIDEVNSTKVRIYG